MTPTAGLAPAMAHLEMGKERKDATLQVAADREFTVYIIYYI
jgi:hypothetical protein